MRAVSRSNESVVQKWGRWSLILVVLVTYLLPGLFSSYRAWVQVRSLDLIVPRRELQSGDTIRVHTVSWARTWVNVDLLLVQGEHSDTLATHEIPKNHNASIDPRWRRDSIDLVVTEPLLKRYERGPATIRVSATGGPQWLRTPPPLVRQVAVQLR